MADRATAAVRLLAGDKEPVRLASTGNLALSGLLTVDGFVTEPGDRVLVKDQTDATQNGIYTASAGTWYRAPDAAASRTLRGGMKVMVWLGTLNEKQVWMLNTDAPNIGTDSIVWVYLVTIDVVTLLALAPLRVVTAAGAVTVSATESGVAINKIVGAATIVNLPTAADRNDQARGAPVKIKDMKRDSSTNPITVTPAGIETIEGLANRVIQQDGGYLELFPYADNSGWYVGSIGF